MRFEFRSIRHKLVSIVMLTTLVALIVSLGMIAAYELRSYHLSLIADMTTEADLLGHMTAPALTFDDKRLATENLNLLRSKSEVRTAAIYDAHGELFATYAFHGEEKKFPQSPEMDTVRVEGTKLHLFKRIVSEGVVIGAVYLSSDYDLLKRALDYLGIAAIATVFALVIVFLMISRLEKLVTRPVYAISKIAREVVEQRNYSRRAEKTSQDEVGMLVDSFNGMLAEIERRTQDLENSNREIARLNADLEIRVSERTVQLQATNEQLIQAKAIAENANQAKSAFLSSMSHELRTPLNAILGFTQLLASQSMRLTAEKTKEFTDHISKAGKHLLALINEVLDLAKVESGALTLSLEPVALSGVILECQEMIEPLGNQRDIRIVFPDVSELNVIADRTRLKQVLINLLSNAIKYNRQMGSVAVSCDVINPERIRISVQDTGAGLHPEQVAALFQPFNRLGQEVGAEEGTGIGLVVTKRLVELMGGEIGVTSTVGIGSIFWVELKYAEANKVAAGNNMARLTQLTQPRPADMQIRTVLYVEDNPANLKLVQEIFSFRPDLRLLTATDANLGIELARVHSPDVILLDINLPGIHGDRALKILHNDPKTSHIPVMALTANAMPRDIEKGLRAGFFRYLTKPINIEEFLEALDSAIELAQT